MLTFIMRLIFQQSALLRDLAPLSLNDRLPGFIGPVPSTTLDKAIQRRTVYNAFFLPSTAQTNCLHTILLHAQFFSIPLLSEIRCR